MEKAAPFKLTNFQLKTIDANKIDGQIYKSSEYNNLFKYIMDIEGPKDSLKYDLILKLSHGQQQPLKNAMADLDAYLEGKQMRENLTPWFKMWKKWFLDKTRFKDHELLDQPVGFIYFVMGNEPDPLASIREMRKNLPIQYQQGLYQDGTPQSGQEFVMVINPNPGTSIFQEVSHTIG